MSGRKYYCFCDSNCKWETMTKEQTLAAIAQAAESGLVFDADAAIVSKVKETNAGRGLSFWVGTQAQYNAQGGVGADCFPIITDAMPYAEIAPVLQAHIVRTDNPHNVTREQLGAAAAIAEKMTLQYASVHAAPNDLLNVTLSGDYNAPNMQHSHVATEDASQLVNSPITSGAFYAVREVEWYWVGHVCVRLREMYPNNGRVWSNMYDTNLKDWYGWKTNEISGNYAPAGYGLGGAEYITADMLDSTTAPGFYHISNTMTINGVTANYWYMRVYAYGSGSAHCTQELHPVGSTSAVFTRDRNSGTWRNWVECGAAAFLPRVLTANDYGDALPAAGTKGRIFFKRV